VIMNIQEIHFSYIFITHPIIYLTYQLCCLEGCTIKNETVLISFAKEVIIPG
jgi:hypothetical protein